LEEPNVEN